MWSPIVVVDVTLVMFRERIFLVAFFITAFAGLSLAPAVSCVYYDRINGKP